MRHRSPKFLEDIRSSCQLILTSTEGKSLDEYKVDRVLTSAVERNFEIIGEAMNRLLKHDPETARSIHEYKSIIAFRNLLIHGYDSIDHRRVWEVIQNDLTMLERQVNDLLASLAP